MQLRGKELRSGEWGALVGTLLIMATDLFLLVVIVPKFRRVYYDLGAGLTGPAAFVVHDTVILTVLALSSSAIAIGVTFITSRCFARVYCICAMVFGLLEAAFIVVALFTPLIGEIQRLPPK
jgi:type II secretory pathway component PulF